MAPYNYRGLKSALFTAAFAFCIGFTLSSNAGDLQNCATISLGKNVSFCIGQSALFLRPVVPPGTPPAESRRVFGPFQIVDIQEGMLATLKLFDLKLIEAVTYIDLAALSGCTTPDQNGRKICVGNKGYSRIHKDAALWKVVGVFDGGAVAAQLDDESLSNLNHFTMMFDREEFIAKGN